MTQMLFCQLEKGVLVKQPTATVAGADTAATQWRHNVNFWRIAKSRLYTNLPIF